MQESKHWYDDDAFWESVSPMLFGERRWADAPTEVEDVVSLVGISAGARVLDLCCGVGRHSLELARRGFLVTGVDRTSAYLETARQQASHEGLDVEFLQDDMRTFCRSEAFDTVLSLFTSFGYFEDPAEDRRVLTNAYRSLRPGGVFLLDVMGKEVLARVFRERIWREEEGIIILEEPRIGKDWGWIDNRWILIRDGEKQEFNFSLRLYSAVEISELLVAGGFDQVDVYGDAKGAPYDHTAKRLIVLAHKGD